MRRQLLATAAALGRRLHREERGAVFVLVAVLAVAFLAIASFVVDYGRIMNAQKELQAAADAAALAAAQDLPDASAADRSVRAYSATQGFATKGNTRPDLTSVTTTYNLKCLNYLKDLGLEFCPNAVQVNQEQEVKLLFLGGLGIPGISVHATATAAAKGGTAFPLDVMIVLDRTGSMDEPLGGSRKIDAARAGVREFLSAMRPSSDLIGLDLFPPTDSSSCPYSEPDHPYENGQRYVVVPLTNSFRSSDTAPLNGSSPLVQAVSGSCPRTGGVTSYTTAIEKAKEELNRDGRPDAQDVIIFFTDGEANYGPYLGAVPNNTPERKQPCHSALDLVNGPLVDKNGAPPAGDPPAFVGGTWIYTILYTNDPNKRCTAAIAKPPGWDAANPTRPWDCQPTRPDVTFPDHSPNLAWRDPLPDPGFFCQEQPHITASSTLQQMASVGSDGATRFYSSDDDLQSIFKRIAVDLSATRLLPDDTQ